MWGGTCCIPHRRALLLLLAAFAAAMLLDAPAVRAGLARDAGFDPVDGMLRALSSGAKRADLVIYNRVPKTGSSTLQQMLDGLSARLAYKAHHFVTPPGIDCRP